MPVLGEGSPPLESESRSLVDLEKVSYAYLRTEQLALKNISLRVRKGEFLGLIGPTGAGKTTLCLALNGIVPQFFGGRFFGHITVAGLDTLESPVNQLARHVGMVFEDPETQITAASVENEIAFALENLRVPRDEILARIPMVLEAVRLEGMEKKHPHELSGGQKQRLAIAAALALQPDLLVLDEPSSQLDPLGAQDVFATLRELNTELGVAVIMASHAAEALAETADRIALLSRGELVTVGPPQTVYADVERLWKHNVRVPEVTRTFYHIAQQGVPLAQLPVRLEPARAALHALPTPQLCSPIPSAAVAEPASRRLLVARDLRHTYADGTQALRGISLDIHAGEYVLIVGQNGAGKSTLVKHFVGLLKPTRGVVLFDGQDVATLKRSRLAHRMGYVAQNPDNQIFNATVYDEVAFALKHLGYSKAVVAARTEKSMEEMGLLPHRDSHPLSLPKGDRARVVVAAILAMRPNVIVFDEPTTGQDYQGAKYILDISRRLHQMGKTVIVITHHLYLMPEYAERVLVLGQGSLLLDAPIRQAYHALDVLRSTYLQPPQAVSLARELFPGPAGGILTPAEVARCWSNSPCE